MWVNENPIKVFLLSVRASKGKPQNGQINLSSDLRWGWDGEGPDDRRSVTHGRYCPRLKLLHSWLRNSATIILFHSDYCNRNTKNSVVYTTNSSQCWRLKVRDEGASMVQYWWGPPSWWVTSHYYLHMAGKDSSAPSSPSKGTHPIQDLITSKSLHLVILWHLKLGFQCLSFEGTQTSNP